MKNIVLIDYGAGNITSVINVLQHMGHTPAVISHVENFSESDTQIIILPGVGDGSFMMKELIHRGFVPALEQWMKKDKPLLGICVGAQVLLSFTQENVQKTLGTCLNFIEGQCTSFVNTFKDVQECKTLKIPHMGWNEVCPNKAFLEHTLFKDIHNNATFYFVHSFYLDPTHKSDVVATTKYGIQFASIIGRGRVFGTQFHPEKSGKNGIIFLRNFLNAVQ